MAAQALLAEFNVPGYYILVVFRAVHRTIMATAIIVGAGNGHGSAGTVAIVSN